MSTKSMMAAALWWLKPQGEVIKADGTDTPSLWDREEEDFESDPVQLLAEITTAANRNGFPGELMDTYHKGGVRALEKALIAWYEKTFMITLDYSGVVSDNPWVPYWGYDTEDLVNEAPDTAVDNMLEILWVVQETLRTASIQTTSANSGMNQIEQLEFDETTGPQWWDTEDDEPRSIQMWSEEEVAMLVEGIEYWSEYTQALFTTVYRAYERDAASIDDKWMQVVAAIGWVTKSSGNSSIDYSEWYIRESGYAEGEWGQWEFLAEVVEEAYLFMRRVDKGIKLFLEDKEVRTKTLQLLLDIQAYARKHNQLPPGRNLTNAKLEPFTRAIQRWADSPARLI